ncbi:unnamed protein product [Rotaria sordida]|uniref:ABC transporter domain-containing protein n=1 Tax=Rotaria sordida TaxID=392033 RepID=A0A815QLS1_9BILA|nr:unnamed protein product [Rotaria sordida]CAF1465004.1 unnamed protein product [Rotaria sordida]
MNHYYYFFLLFHYYLAVHLCDALQSGGLLFDFNDNTHDQSSIKEYCETFITYNQVVTLLSRNTCASIENSKKNKNKNDRIGRQIDAGNFDIKALQTTVNDHRTMIEYLFNNTINETVLAKALYDHSRKAPSFTSWRDLIDIFCIGLVLIMLGAGKTTTFRIVVGDLMSTQGTAYIDGQNVHRRIRSTSRLGYCPQENCGMEFLTVQDSLYLLAPIRGIRWSRIEKIVSRMSSLFLLEPFLNNYIHQLNGETKRSLHAALALIGPPLVATLDEPTTGVDLDARQ